MWYPQFLDNYFNPPKITKKQVSVDELLDILALKTYGFNWDSRQVINRKPVGVYVNKKEHYHVDTDTVRRWTSEISKKLREIKFEIDYTLLFKAEFNLKFLEYYNEKNVAAAIGRCKYWFLHKGRLNKRDINFFFDYEVNKIKLIEPLTGDIFEPSPGMVIYFAEI
jgi:hypothetical protein